MGEANLSFNLGQSAIWNAHGWSGMSNRRGRACGLRLVAATPLACSEPEPSLPWNAVLCTSCYPAIQTLWSMHTDQLRASWAHPACVLTSDELPDPQFLYLRQVVQHAHDILCSVPPIKAFQSHTGEGNAGMVTVLLFTLAAESQSATPTTLGAGSQTAITSVLVTDIPDTKAAVHPARSYVRHLGA